MGKPKKPNFRARQLSRALQRLREQANYGQKEVADRMRCSTTKISRLESGQVPIYAELEKLLDIYGIPVSDWDEYIQMYERACERGWWHAYGLDDKDFVSLEAEASRLSEYQLGYIPGLFQTEAYIRAGFAQARKPMKGDALENAIAVRLRRQRRLIERPVLTVHAIIDESVIRRPILEDEDRRAQLRQVIERSELATVTTQVIPLSLGAHSGRAGSFYILGYAERDEPDIAYVEHGFGSSEIEKEDQVAAARLFFEHLAGIALSEQDSIALIERVITEI